LKVRLDLVDAKINWTEDDPAELCFDPTVNYLSAAKPACDIT
jgi:hypothetical protein